MIIDPFLYCIPRDHEIYPYLVGAKAYLSNASQPPEHWNIPMKANWLNHYGSQSYIYLTYSQNIRLFEKLRRDGVFDFYISNDGNMIGFHQIVSFYFSGGKKALRNGFTCRHKYQEIHHVNGNTLDNNPDNLYYLTTKMHKIITAHQRGAFWRIPKHRWQDLSEDSTPIWNRQGKLVKNPHAFLSNILARTLKATHEWVRNCKGYLKGIVEWVNRILSYLNQGLDTTFVPNPEFVPHSDNPFRRLQLEH